MPTLRFALAQTNPVVGDFSANLEEALGLCLRAAGAGAELVVFGEHAASGYPIEDLATRRDFLTQLGAALLAFAKNLESSGLGSLRVLLGAPRLAESPSAWAIAHNSAALIHGGAIQAWYDKHHLPNYGVFDERRIYIPGDTDLHFELSGVRLAVVICEDIWQQGGPVARLGNGQTDLTLVLNGSPFEVNKLNYRVDLASSLASAHDCAVAYVNLVGGQDDLVFDGGSFVLDTAGKLVDQAPQFESDLSLYEIDPTSGVRSIFDGSRSNPSMEWQVWNALRLGIHDYVSKNGFRSVILGLSGGIDSAVVATLAVDALGDERVFGVAMPSAYSSDHSMKDAGDLAERLGIRLTVEPIAELFDGFGKQIPLDGLAAENLQARLRGLILMSLSNRDGHLVLTTGNKTELAVGYSTIYGDSVGGFAPIKDIEKTLVWRLARWRNSLALEQGVVAPIPDSSITKAPSAELRPGQLDQDSLPPYDLLDEILRLHIDQREGRDQLLARGFEVEVVDKVLALVSRAEWKRRQGAIGPKITGMSFGRDRRVPITNRFG